MGSNWHGQCVELLELINWSQEPILSMMQVKWVRVQWIESLYIWVKVQNFFSGFLVTNHKMPKWRQKQPPSSAQDCALVSTHRASMDCSVACLIHSTHLWPLQRRCLSDSIEADSVSWQDNLSVLSYQGWLPLWRVFLKYIKDAEIKGGIHINVFRFYLL